MNDYEAHLQAVLLRESERFPGMRQLDELAQRDAFIRAHLTRWHRGDYPSFEACLIAMICDLNAQLKAYRDREVVRMESAPNPLITTQKPT